MFGLNHWVSSVLTFAKLASIPEKNYVSRFRNKPHSLEATPRSASHLIKGATLVQSKYWRQLQKEVLSSTQTFITFGAKAQAVRAFIVKAQDRILL